jgi:hypothetical protein
VKFDAQDLKITKAKSIKMSSMSEVNKVYKLKILLSRIPMKTVIPVNPPFN